MPPVEVSGSFASVYDVLYEDVALLAVQAAFLSEHLGPPGLILDAGCGPGLHLPLLSSLGHRPVGLDRDEPMLTAAQRRSQAGGLVPWLVRGDIRRLPFVPGFDGIVCLESPLAYLLADEDLAACLLSFRVALRPGGRLIIDVFDYPAAAGRARIPPATQRFTAPWGSVDVTESHRHDRKTGLWSMRQQFRVERGDASEEFEVRHRFRTRTGAEYAAALEEAGFAVDGMWPGYPNAPLSLQWERRILITAHRG